MCSVNGITHFVAFVVGTRFPNSDGSDRQAIAAECVVGEQVLLVPEPDNPVDPDAVAVYRDGGGQIGYLAAEVAAVVAKEIAYGWHYAAYIWETKVQEYYPNDEIMVDLVVFRSFEDLSGQAVRQYVDSVPSLLTAPQRPLVPQSSPGVDVKPVSAWPESPHTSTA